MGRAAQAEPVQNQPCSGNFFAVLGAVRPSGGP